jgi:beta-galactosidase
MSTITTAADGRTAEGTAPSGSVSPASARDWPRGTSDIRYGGDYNPEQWPREVWLEDIELMKSAGINLVSIGIFSWVLLEPREGEYDFSFLDDIFGLLAEAGIDVDLGTPTAAPPAWFWKKYPNARPVTRDGIPLGFGSRGMVSPSSPEYRRACVALVEKLAEHFAGHPALAMWHVHNEYGAPISDSYDDASVAAFRVWLEKRYGSLDGVNDAWGTLFWGQRYGEWDEIDAPRLSASTTNPTQRLDFQRFTSDALLACFVAERDAIRRFTPDLAVTTNFMATNCPSIDYWKWAKEVDVVANDHYLVAERADNHIHLAMDADFTRSLAGNRPWMLLEHSTSAVNWQPRNIAKRPGEMARNSLSHMGRGSDAIMFFQFRASRYGAEKFHSAMLPHAGATSRVWREVVALGADLQRLAPVRGSRVTSRVAILWDIESFWAQDLDWRPSAELGHRERIEAFYTQLYLRGVSVDFAHPRDDLSGYDVVFAPALYLVDRESAANIDSYVRGGGHLAVSYFSGIVDQNDTVYEGAFPGALRSALGIAVEEFLPLHENERVTLDNGMTGAAWSDDLALDGATAIATFTSGPGAGIPAITRNEAGSGSAWYVSTKLDGDDLGRFVSDVLADAGIAAELLPDGLEITTRQTDSETYTFLINHSEVPIPSPTQGTDLLTGAASAADVPARGVMVVASGADS